MFVGAETRFRHFRNIVYVLGQKKTFHWKDANEIKKFFFCFQESLLNFGELFAFVRRSFKNFQDVVIAASSVFHSATFLVRNNFGEFY